MKERTPANGNKAPRASSGNVVNLKKYRTALAKKAKPPRFDALSFVTRNKRPVGGYNYWDVTPSGSYGTDCLDGEILAREFLAFIGAHPTNANGTLLNSIVHEMIKQAKAGAEFGGLHIGFLGCVNRFAMAMASMSHPSSSAK